MKIIERAVWSAGGVQWRRVKTARVKIGRRHAHLFGSNYQRNTINKIRTWRLPNGMHKPTTISGRTIVEAIERDWEVVISRPYAPRALNNPAEHRLISVNSRYQPGIIGGHGGVAVVIHYHVNDSVGPTREHVVWIEADPADLPADRFGVPKPYNHPIKGGETDE
ncbi:MAG: hypothetical protein U9M89_01650 [Patescibacteria group bacterium]|nr:hypothetical protein [Patescibacteria group bacterium]